MHSRSWPAAVLLGASLVLTTACGLHLGRAPVVTSQVSLGEVLVGVPEPRLQEDLGRALARELASRSSVGVGPAVSARVVSASAAPVAPRGSLWEAHLVVDFQLALTPPVTVRRAGERLFEGTEDSWDATSASRAAAFGALAEQLAAEAVPVLLSTPLGDPS